MQTFYLANASNAAQGQQQQQQQQQQQKDWAQLSSATNSSQGGSRPPAIAAAERQPTQQVSLSNPAPPAYTTTSNGQQQQQQQQQVDASRAFALPSFRDSPPQLSHNPSSAINAPPTHYTVSNGQVVYLHSSGSGGSSSGQGSAMMSLGQPQPPPQQMLMSPSTANVNILPGGGSLMYPTMTLPSAGGNGAVAYYVPTPMSPSQHQQQQQQQLSAHHLSLSSGPASTSARTNSAGGHAATGGGLYLLQPASQQQQQQQQQHAVLLNPANTTMAGAPSSVNPPLSYFVVPTQQVELNNFAALTSYHPMPFTASHAMPIHAAAPPPSMMAAYLARPASTQNLPQNFPQQQQQQQQQTSTNAATTWVASSPTARQAHHPPPLQTFPPAPSMSAANDEKLTVAAASASSSQPTTGSAHLQTSEALLLSGSAHSRNASTHGSSSSRGNNNNSGGGVSMKRGGGVRRGQSSNSVDVNAAASANDASITSQLSASTQGRPYAEDPVAIDTTKRQLIVNYLPQRLTDERFKDLFRPYGELMEEASHIIYDFRHHKMVPVQSSLTTEVPSSVVVRAASDTTPLSFDKEPSTVSILNSTTGATTTTATAATPSTDLTTPMGGVSSSGDLTSLTSPGVLTRGSTEDSAAMSTGGVGGGSNPAAPATRSMPRSKGYGFIYYKDGASTERAIKELNGKEVDGKRIKVRYAEQQRCLEPESAATVRDTGAEPGAEVHLRSAASDGESDEESEVDILDIDAFKVDDD